MKQATIKALENTLAAVRIISVAIQEDTNSVLASGDVPELIRHFDKMRETNELIKIARKSLEILEDRLSKSEIPDAFRRIGVKTMTVEDVGRVSIGHRWSCSIIDKPIGFQYLREQGDGGLIIETVNSSTLAAHAKDLMDTQGKELPKDKFVTSINAYTSITKV